MTFVDVVIVDGSCFKVITSIQFIHNFPYIGFVLFCATLLYDLTGLVLGRCKKYSFIIICYPHSYDSSEMAQGPSPL